MKKQEVFPIKVSISKEYKDIIDFYTTKEGHSLSRLVNVLLAEAKKNKPFKFKVLKSLENL